MTAPYRLRRLKRAVLCGLVRRYPSLVDMLPAVTPLDLRRFCDLANGELIVFLPGIGDMPDDFELNGFIDALRGSARACDAIVADVHFGYYIRRSLFERLREDVVEPARAAGYSTIVLAGISLGGFGALLYAIEHSRDIDGLMLLAPYVGEQALANEISGAGGLHKWAARDVGGDDPARRLWRALSECAAAGTERLLRRSYLGFGAGDPFATGNTLLAQMLPHENVFTIRGGHDWKTWKRLWQMFLAARDSRVEDGELDRV